MAATKTARTLLTSQSLAAATSVNATELNLSTAYGALVTVKITNGASAPTTAPTITWYVGEATTVKRQFYQTSGNTTNSSVTDYVCEIPAKAMFNNVTILNGATNAITVEVYAQELTTV
jgi:hypothetical protein